MTARRLTVLWYGLAAILTANGIVQVTIAASGARASQWVIAAAQLAGGVAFLAGAVLTHRDYRRRDWKLRPPIRER